MNKITVCYNFKTYKVFFVIILFSINIYSQNNLVYNGSFEDYYSCPCRLNNTDTFDCKGWWSPNDATPDYFNKCWLNKTEKNFCENRYEELAS